MIDKNACMTNGQIIETINNKISFLQVEFQASLFRISTRSLFNRGVSVIIKD